MPINPRARLTALLFVGLALTLAPAQAQDAADADDALEHIRLLEQMLRDAGVEPPARPGELSETARLQQPPIVPESIDTGPLGEQVRLINARGDNTAVALRRVRAGLKSDDPAHSRAASDIIFAVYDWVDTQLKVAQAMVDDDAVGAYMLVDDALDLVGRDPSGRPLQDFVKQLQLDRGRWRDIESQAAFRRSMLLAESVGLTGDWSIIDFQNNKVCDEIDRITGKLKLVKNAWPGTKGAELAAQILKDWQAREAQAIADLPKWRYTWNLSLILLGTEQTTVIQTTADGRVIITEDIDIVYEQKRVEMFGTFQNTSDKSYRYTFVVGVSTQFNADKPWTGESNKHTHYTVIQTPVLAPGELYNWATDVAVRDAGKIRRAGLAKVEPHEPGRR